MKNFYHRLAIGITILSLAGNSSLFATDLTPRAQASSDKNYIHTIIPQNSAADVVIESVQYFDGLGRPSQTVSWQASPTGHDIITPIFYDDFGRENKKYLPYSGTNTSGNFVTDPFPAQSTYYSGLYGSDGPNAFSKTEFEASPLNRVLKQGAPGAVWQPNGTPSADHSVKFDYGANTTGEVKRWKVVSDALTDDGSYDANKLSKTITWDENNNSSDNINRTEEFKDFQGKVVLKRSKNGSETLSTYYVYDDFDMLRFVLTPKAMEDNAITGNELNDLCYQYNYDGRKRMIGKKLPGADWVYMVYDNRDRLVLTQDGNARFAGKWMFTKYDSFNRPVMTGYLTPGLSEEQLRSIFSNYTGTMFETAQTSGNIGYSFNDSYPDESYPGLSINENNILSITYYDNYGFLGISGFSSYAYTGSYDIDTYADNDGTNDGYFDNMKGQVTATKIKVLDGNEFTYSAQWLYQANYYDDRYRIIQSRRTLYDGSSGGIETSANQYDFTGKLTQNKLVQTFNGVPTMVDKYLTYDSQGRLTKTEQEIMGDANGRVTVAENIYNETGQLVSKKLHKQDFYDYLQNVDYSYNIRGWLTSINNPDNLSTNLFGERLLYETPESDLTGSTDVQYNGNISGMVWNSTQKSKQGYRFTYDGLNRLTLGDYKYYSGGWYDNYKYEERYISYDKNGNLNTLGRYDQNGNNNFSMTCTYNGNQLSCINSFYYYAYDQNGNTTTDGLRGMTVGYNVLNLPNSISKGSESISYIYSASGEKLAKRMKDYSYQYYAGSMVYNSDKSLKYILFEEGLVNKSSGAYTYEYHLKDHLGNTRVAFQPNGGSTTTTQVAEYYPFGSSYLPQDPAGSNKYLYNGKEKQDDVLSYTALDEYDYGSRFYDPELARFQILDPKATNYYFQSPYCYAANNPIRYIDKDGKNPVIIVGGIVLTATDLALIAMGVVTTGVILHKAADGSFALNQGIKDLFSFSPGYREQQKRERTAKESLDRNQAKVQKSIDDNVGKPSPDGTPDPKRDADGIGKIIIGTGLAAETGKGIYENVTKSNDSKDTGTGSSNENKTSTQPVIKSADAKNDNTESNLPASTWTPFPQKKDKQIQIPLRE